MDWISGTSSFIMDSLERAVWVSIQDNENIQKGGTRVCDEATRSAIPSQRARVPTLYL